MMNAVMNEAPGELMDVRDRGDAADISSGLLSQHNHITYSDHGSVMTLEWTLLLTGGRQARRPRLRTTMATSIL